MAIPAKQRWIIYFIALALTVVAVTARTSVPAGMPLRAVLPKPLDLRRLLTVVDQVAPRPAA